MKLVQNFLEVGQQIAGDLDGFNLALSNSIFKSVSEASDGLKNDLRTQVLAAGLGQRVANTWQNKGRMGGKTLYPDPGKARLRKGLDAVAYIFSKAPAIIQAFDEGGLIHRPNGFYMAIPTGNVPIGVQGKRLKPRDLKDRGYNLEFVKAKGGNGVLVARTLRPSYEKKTGRLRGYKQPSVSYLVKGKPTQDIVMFLLIKQVSLAKRFDVKSVAIQWQNTLAELISANIDTEV